jgi:hypothetical protein
MRLIVDGRPYPFEPGDSLLIALLRAGIQPTGGGCLCLGGDCPNCLATVDGVSYVRTCQTAAKPGTVVELPSHLQKYPPLPAAERVMPAVPARNLFCDVVVIGAGEVGANGRCRSRSPGQTSHRSGRRPRPGGDWHLPRPAGGGPHRRRNAAHPRPRRNHRGHGRGGNVAHRAGRGTGRAAHQPCGRNAGPGGPRTWGASWPSARPPAGLEVERAEGELVRFEGENA